MFKNVIFDLGNVLLRFNPVEYLRTKIDDENRVQQVYHEIFLSEEWLMLDRGVISEEEAVERIMKRSAGNGHFIQMAMNRWYDSLIPIEETVDILKKVKAKGYQTYILSNFHLLAYESVINRYDFFQYFDEGIISYSVKLLKPETEIYNSLITRCGIEPSESIFIDDTKVNIESAKNLGFKAILFDKPMGLHLDLVELGILDKL